MFHALKRKQIILVRHAKALEGEEFDGGDFDRPLSEKGENSLRIIAKYLRLIGVKPDRILSSPAMRAKQTAEILFSEFKNDKIEYIADLYFGKRLSKKNPNTVHLAALRSTKKSARIALLVGHNPDLSAFASYLCGQEVPSMKKGSVVVLSVPDDLSWKEITEGKCEYVYYLTPQFLKIEDLV